MKRQIQRQNNHKYFQHLHRLANAKSTFTVSHQNSKDKSSETKDQKRSNTVKLTKLKCKTENIHDKSQSRILPIILPLVPHTERQLLGKSLSIRKIRSREAEIILQNYLMSRRILRTKPLIKLQQLEKDYKSHEKYSNNLSKRKLESIQLSQSRVERYKEFEKSKINSYLQGASKIIGLGKYCFTIQINKILMINIKETANDKIFNLTLQLGKKIYEFKHLKINQMKENHSFFFKRKQIKYESKIVGKIDKVNGVDLNHLGNFVIDISEPVEMIKSTQKLQDFEWSKKDEVQGLRSSRNNKLVGTILFNIFLQRHIQ